MTMQQSAWRIAAFGSAANSTASPKTCRAPGIAIGSYAVTRAPFSWRRWITRIEAASRRDLPHSDPGDLLGDVGHRVDVTDLGRQERVARVLDHLGRLRRRLDRRRDVVPVEGAVESLEAARGCGVNRSDHEFVRM